ncbi:MAG: aminoacyl-tRNA hydrolase [Deltaproteobacteria bacterium]|jgi:ribosome-associated protein|nr:aminoacyl-tRNA hydrolase [Deltaproteobacteria bacterium]
MIQITPTIFIDERELRETFIRSAGPGGQNVNKASTAVQLYFDVVNSPSLPNALRRRLIDLAGKRMTKSGVLVISARRFRTQEQNRRDAFERLTGLIRQAAEKPRQRRKTVPSAASKRRRLNAKRRRGEIKRMRRFSQD